MRHDPASAAVVIMLRSLKMYGMAQAVTDLIEQGAPAFDGERDEHPTFPFAIAAARTAPSPIGAERDGRRSR